MPFLLIILCSIILSPAIQTDKKEYYNVLKGNSPEKMTVAIEKIQKEKQTELSDAYIGALYIKKSSFIKKSSEKLKTFKTGKKLLEESILKYPENPEMRLLRIIIQENCPKQLKYNINIKEDKDILIKHYSNCNSELKSIIIDYAKTSRSLNQNDFI